MMTSPLTRTGWLFLWFGLLTFAPLGALGQDAAATTSGTVRGEQAFPTGNASTSVLLIRHIGPAEMRVNAPFTYEVQVRNLTDANLPEVVITEKLPNAFKVSSIDPKPADSGEGTASWTLTQLGPKASQVIKISGTPSAVGAVSYCTTVAFKTTACAETQIVEPALKLVKTAPAEVIICDPIPVKLVVTNTGTGAVQNVKVVDKLPDGWESGNSKDAINFDAGTLKPGESREFSFQAKATKTGSFVNEATASEPGGLAAKASSETVVRKPALSVTKTGPEIRYIGRPAEYKITVTNTGDAPAKDTTLVDTVSGVGEFVKASDGGQSAGGKVTWSLGTLEPGASKSVELTLVGQKAGTIKDDAVATAYCAQGQASASTEVKGVPAILLEVVDVSDPIEVGADETYIITVTNQGTADDTNIRIECTLPAEEDYVSAEGPTKFKAEGKTVSFEPLATLAPKAKATYRVVVKGTKEQDVRFKTSMTSDMLKSPVEETESTHIY
ncbi:MAG: DUF11 domain-containing protein [Phycisphaerae bacterium]|nr:DUF11 domain-containing protein [Phycisphaerae bacterium]